MSQLVINGASAPVIPSSILVRKGAVIAVRPRQDGWIITLDIPDARLVLKTRAGTSFAVGDRLVVDYSGDFKNIHISHRNGAFIEPYPHFVELIEHHPKEFSMQLNHIAPAQSVLAGISLDLGEQAPKAPVLLEPKAVTLTMSSREIAELCEKEHKNVMADIRAMFEQLEMTRETSAQFSADLPDAYGRKQPVFNLPKDLTLTLVSGYNVKLRKRIIDHWLQLEEAQGKIALPNFINPAEAAIAWAEQYKAREEAEARALEAERAKSLIGSKREATAMATASVKAREAEKLKIELDQSKQYATVKRMEMLYHGQKFNWRLLKSTGIEMGIPPTEIFDQNYGTVKAYHADVWREAYALDIPA
ncbi:MAG: Rha family transcriptional regulator [Zoogloeaceae bacterium]|jgi:phage regulator Rha-like protein|nr:Rha family transcriptional regulator [Zoogloeaceae bacterium]